MMKTGNLAFVLTAILFFQPGKSFVCFPEKNEEKCSSCSAEYYSTDDINTLRGDFVLRSTCTKKNSSVTPVRKIILGYPDQHTECLSGNSTKPAKCVEFLQFLNGFDFYYENLFEAFKRENSIMKAFAEFEIYFYVFGEVKAYPIDTGNMYQINEYKFFRRIFAKIFVLPLECDSESQVICSIYSMKSPIIFFQKQNLPRILVASLMSIKNVHIIFENQNTSISLSRVLKFIELESIIDRNPLVNAELNIFNVTITDSTGEYFGTQFVCLSNLGGTVKFAFVNFEKWASAYILIKTNAFDEVYQGHEALKLIKNGNSSLEISGIKFIKSNQSITTKASLISINNYGGIIKIQDLEISDINSEQLIFIFNCRNVTILLNIVITNSILKNLIYASQSEIYIQHLHLNMISFSDTSLVQISDCPKADIYAMEMNCSDNKNIKTAAASLLISSCAHFSIRNSLFYKIYGFRIEILYSNVTLLDIGFLNLIYLNNIYRAFATNTTVNNSLFTEIKGSGVMLKQVRDDLIILNSRISFVEGIVVIDYDEIRSNIIANCEILFINNPLYFWARNLEIKEQILVNITFSNSYFRRLQSLYRQFSFYPLIIYKDCLFLNMSFGTYLADYCCLDIFFVNVTYKYIIMPNISGALFALESEGNYAYINTNFLDIGWTVYRKSSSGSINQVILFLWFSNKIVVTNCNFTNNLRLYLRSGFIGCNELNHTIAIENSSFIVRDPKIEFPVKGILLMMIARVEIKNSLFINLTGDIFSNQYTHINGVLCLLGSLSLLEKKGNKNSAFFENVTIKNVNSLNGAGLAVVSYQNLTILNCLFYNGTAQNGIGGLIIVISVDDLSIASTNFSTGSAVSGGLVYVELVETSLFENCNFHNSQASENGGCITLISTEATFLNSNISKCKSFGYGGFIYQGKGRLNFVNGTACEIKSSLDGGVFYMEDVFKLAVYGFNISLVEIKGKGGLLFGEIRTIVMEMILVNEINSQGDGTIFIVENFFSLKINGIAFKNASCLLYCKKGLMLADSLLSENKVDVVNLFLSLVVSNMKASLFLINSDSKIYIHTVEIVSWEGGSILSFSGLSLLEASIIKIKISYYKSYAQKSFLFENSIINLIDCKFIEGILDLYLVKSIQSTLFVYDFFITGLLVSNTPSVNCILFFMETCKFLLNQFTIEKDKSDHPHFYLFSSELILLNSAVVSSPKMQLLTAFNSNLSLHGSNFSFYNTNTSTRATLIFYRSNPQGFLSILNCDFSIIWDICIDVYDVRNMSIRNSSLIGHFVDGSVDRSAVFVTGVSFLSVSHSLFRNLKAKHGAALTIFEFSKFNRISSIDIFNCTFSNNHGNKGTVFFISSLLKLILKDCSFYNNSATEIGGVGFIDCKNTPTLDCHVEVITNNFSSNMASNHSAIIFSNTFISMSKNDVQGDNSTVEFIVYPLKVSLVQNGKVAEKLVFQSGVPENFSITLTDSLGKVLSYDSSSLAKIQPTNKGLSNTQLQNFIAFFKSGTSLLENFLIKSKPNTELNLTLNIDLLSDPLNERKILEFQIPVVLGVCQEGHVIQLDSTCRKCEKGTFSFSNPENRIECLKCLPNFECRGGSEVYPLPGFWRETKYDTKVVNCIIKESCLGGNKANMTFSDSDAVHGACAEGHKGILCFNCKKGFGKEKSQSLCNECKYQQSTLITRVFVIILLVILFLIFSNYYISRVNATINSSQRKYPANLVFFKLILKHLQTISIISFMEDLSEVPNLPNIINFLSYFSLVNDDFIFFDCLLEQESEDNTLFKTVGVILLPMVLSCISLFVWLVFGFKYYFKGFFFGKSKINSEKPENFNLLARRLLVTFALAAYLLYPKILQSIFSLPNCITLDNGITKPKNYLFVNPNIMCWEGLHSYMIIFVFTPSFILWGFLFPLFLYKTFKEGKHSKTFGNERYSDMLTGRPQEKKRIDKFFDAIEFKSFQFFYKNYTDQHYYWEIIIFFKKLVLTGIAGIRNLIGVDLKLVLIQITIIIYSVFVMKKRPFLILKYNFYELISGVLTIIFILTISAVLKERGDLPLFLGYLSMFLNVLYIICLLLEGAFYNFIKRKKLNAQSKQVDISRKCPTSNKIKLNYGTGN